MIRFVPIIRLKKLLFFIILVLFVFLPLLGILYQENSLSHNYEISKTSGDSRYRRYCQQMDQRISVEQALKIPIKLDSTYGYIPYSYSQWRFSPLMPRLLTQCEHAVYMNLLSILIERLFKKYNIQYMMMGTTLLGSYTRHDVLPWDDDVDLLVSVSDRYNLQSVILGELSSEPYSVILLPMHNQRNYDKVFFSWCPHAGNQTWRFPFIDIFYHDQNSTHVWLLGKPSNCPVRHEDIFPLVLRPLGPLWLYAPREPMAHFESRKMSKIETGCYAYSYSHKYEKRMRDYIMYANCTELKSIYPYVERQCVSNQCIENLKLGDTTTIHTLNYNYSYRTFLYAETNKSYQAC